VSAGQPLSARELFALTVYWFGLNFHWTALLVVVIPSDILALVPQAEKGTALAGVLGWGALIAMITMPLAGALSDLSRHPLGRRRPFMVAGGLLNVAGLLLLAQAPSFGAYRASYYVVQGANNFGGAAYGGLFADVVPEQQRGLASGWMGLMIMLATIIGGAAAGLLLERGERGLVYGLIAAILGLSLAYTTGRVREKSPARAERFALAEFLRGFWVDPRQHPDFAWLFASRILILLGFYVVLDFAQFFLKDFMGFADFKARTGILSAAVMIGALPSAYAAGRLSDRLGRRVIVFVAGIVMAGSIALFLIAPAYSVLLGLSIVFGIGFGAFTSADWALAIDVLPSKDAAARLLGIWGIAATVPQVLAPATAGPLLDAFNRQRPNFGYVVILALGAVCIAIGAGLVWLLRRAR
jgi:MFS family permease